MADKVFQLKWYCSTGVWPRGAQVRQRCGRSLSPLSSMQTMIRPSFLAFFLTPASVLASSAESSLHPALTPALPGADNSNPVAAECARLGKDRISPHIPARSDRPPVLTSTGWLRIPGLVGHASIRSLPAASPQHSVVACVLLAPPSSGRAVLAAVVVPPTDLRIADALQPCGRPRPDYIPSRAAAPPAAAAAPTCRNLCELPLDFPCGEQYHKISSMSLYYSIIDRRLDDADF